MTMLFATILALLGTALGIAGTLLVVRLFGSKAPEHSEVRAVAERVRAVGRFVGLEVHAKEIATAKKGWNWMPPAILSQARLAMIFEFEKQYSVDLASVRPGDIEELGEGRFRLKLPPIRGTLRLVALEPYDIQDGRVLGLLDVIQMNAERQAALMADAQDQAANLFEKNETRYLANAAEAIETHLQALISLFGVEVEIAWPDGSPIPEEPMEQPELITDDVPAVASAS
ncbi:MAG: DUF4230 domain-containing protein [Planctomycetota bacterium]